MSTPKNSDLEKHTMNLRTGDMKKLGQLFPKTPPSVTVRNLVAKIVDKYYVEAEVPSIDPANINL
mgnify:CR=1 FL=1